MATASEEFFCEPCEQNGLQIPADVWCNDCGEGYCHECVKSHKVVKTLRNHHIISIADRTKIDSQNICDICPEHDVIYSLFCLQHDSILCLNCFQSNHSQCKIVDLAEAAKGSKTSTAIVSLEKEIADFIGQLKDGKEAEDSNVSSLKKEEEITQKELEDVVSKIIKHINNLQENLEIELRGKFDKSRNEIAERSRNLDNDEKRMTQMMQQVSILKEFGSEKQAFIATRQLTCTLKDERTAIQTTLANCTNIQLSLKVDGNVQSVFNLKSLGEVTIDRTHRVTKASTSTESQAIKEAIPRTDINNISLTLNRTVTIGKDNKAISITSCVLMPDKKMVFVDNIGNRLIIHKANGEHRLDVILHDKPFDCTVVDKIHVAVTLPNTSLLVIHNTVDGSSKCRIFCATGYYGVCCIRDNLYVCDSSFQKVNIIDMSGNNLGHISMIGGEIYNISIFENSLYYTSFRKGILYALSENGNKIWEKTDMQIGRPTCFKYNYSTSLTTDNHGNVFVVLPESNCVTVVSRDGKNKRDILTKSDNHQNPSGISFLSETNQLLVCDVSDRYAALYDVKY